MPLVAAYHAVRLIGLEIAASNGNGNGNGNHKVCCHLSLLHHKRFLQPFSLFLYSVGIVHNATHAHHSFTAAPFQHFQPAHATPARFTAPPPPCCATAKRLACAAIAAAAFAQPVRHLPCLASSAYLR